MASLCYFGPLSSFPRSLVKPLLACLAYWGPGALSAFMTEEQVQRLDIPMMITDAGDKIWRSYFGKPPAETNISG